MAPGAWLQVTVACVVWACVSCNSPAKPPVKWQDHAEAPPATATKEFPALTVPEARTKLTAARAADKYAAALVYANRLVTAGGELTADEAAYVSKAVDHAPGDVLVKTRRHLDAKHAPAPLVSMRLALLAYHRGELSAADSLLDGLTGLPAPLAKRAATLRKQIKDRQTVDRQAIAVLLPLSGPYSVIGAEMRAAFDIAARLPEAKGVTFHYLDTRGATDGAVAAVDKAVLEHHAIAIVGPVGQRESRAAAARAAELRVPIALLSAGGAANAAAGVFRLWSSSRWEAREAARVAKSLGYDRFAVFAPRDAEGAAMANEFQRAATAVGAKVLAVGQYNPTGTDLEKEMKAFLGLDPKTNARLRRHLRRRGWKKGWKSFSPTIQFEVLFVPDDYQVAALVASYLPFFNVEVRSRDIVDVLRLRKKHGGRIPQLVQVIGASGWHHLGLIPRGGPAVEGALVVDVFSGGDNEEYATDEGAELGKVFKARTRRTPGPLAAQAYDAARLVLAARDRAHTARRLGPRAAFVRALVGSQLTDGACGRAKVTRGGELHREATLLRVDGGEFVVHEH